MLKLILSRGLHRRLPASSRVFSSLYRIQVPTSKCFSSQAKLFSPNTEEPKEKIEADETNEKIINKDMKSAPEVESDTSKVEAEDNTTLNLTNKRRSLRVREKITSSLTPLNVEKLRLQLQFREASDAPCLSKLPAIPASQWNQARLSLLSCLNLPARREKANEDASSLFSAGDSILLASIYPGSTYFLDSLVEHLAHSTKSSVLSFNVHDLQSMDFVSRAFPSNPDSALPIYPDSKSLNRLFSNVPVGAEHSSQGSNFRREEDEDEDEDEEDDEDYDAPPSKSQNIYSSEVPGFFSFLSSSRPTPVLTSEDLLVGRRLRKGFFHLINDASWKGGAEQDGLVIHFRDTISSLLDRSGHVVVRGLYQAIQDYRVASGKKVALVVTVSPSFLNPLLLKNHSFSDVTRRFMSDVGRSDWARHFTLVNVHPYLLNPNSNKVALKPDGATAISAASWMQELDSAYRRRALEINLKNLFGLCLVREAELKVDYDPADLDWSGHLANQIWPKVHLVRLASALTGYTSESLLPLDKAALVHCLQLVPFPDFEPAPSSSPTEGGKPVALVEPITPSKLEVARRSCDSYERKLLGCVVNPDSMVVGFEDIRIAPQTVATLQNLITLPLLRPAWFSTGVLARHFISGVLLFGPPGTGKTLLAKAVAKESGSAVLEIKGSDIYNKYVGEGEKAVQALFRLARRLTPCVVFIDEVDVLFGARRNDSPSSGRREIINQFMLEWDGLTSANKGIMIMAATNRPFDLDDAVLRRLPRRILVDLPNKGDRHHILQLHLQGESLSADVCLATLADKTEGYSGSDLKNLCVSAAVAALQDLVRTELGAPPKDKTFDLKKLSPPGEGDTPRILNASHFVTALSQVNASISDEMGSVLELRKWDKQFGDGAKARSKKLALGFGTAVPPSISSPSP